MVAVHDDSGSVDAGPCFHGTHYTMTRIHSAGTYPLTVYKYSPSPRERERESSMACINQGMYGGGGRGVAPPPVGPRISFSNDFALDAATGRPAVRYERAPAAAAGNSPDFEFSVESYGMMAADELFFKGRLMPLQEQSTAAQIRRMTLRDELQAGNGEDDGGLTFSPPPSSSASSRLPNRMALRWKALMGLGKAKQDKKQHDVLHHQQRHEDNEKDEEEVFGNASSHISTSR